MSRNGQVRVRQNYRVDGFGVKWRDFVCWLASRRRPDKTAIKSNQFVGFDQMFWSVTYWPPQKLFSLDSLIIELRNYKIKNAV